MNDYWRIWFRLYKNDEFIGAGVWNQYYKYKKNAVRRARKMWSQDIYEPTTNVVIRREWIVSQTNPWALGG